MIACYRLSRPQQGLTQPCRGRCRRQASFRLSFCLMAPPAEFSYGPTGADSDARFLARGDHGVQFPQAALDQWRTVLPGLPWISVHGEWGLSRGACCRLVAIAAWSQKAAPIRASFLKKTWRLQFIAVVLTAMGELPLDWAPTVFSIKAGGTCAVPSAARRLGGP